MSGKAMVITVIEFLVTAVFHENRCCAQQSSSAAQIAVPLSELYFLSSPAHHFLEVLQNQLARGKGCSIKHYTQKCLCLAQSQVALGALSNFLSAPLSSLKAPLQTFPEPCHFSVLYSFPVLLQRQLSLFSCILQRGRIRKQPKVQGAIKQFKPEIVSLINHEEE